MIASVNLFWGKTAIILMFLFKKAKQLQTGSYYTFVVVCGDNVYEKLRRWLANLRRNLCLCLQDRSVSPQK